jgi:hypothetical protein
MVGGRGRVGESLAAWLSERGHEVTVATGASPGELEPGCPYKVRLSPNRASFLRAIRRCDVVHVNGLSLRALVPSLSARAVSEYLGKRQGLPSNRTILRPVAPEAFEAAVRGPGEDTPSGSVALAELCAQERGFVADHQTSAGLTSAHSEALDEGEERARRAARAHLLAMRELSAERPESAFGSVHKDLLA